MEIYSSIEGFLNMSRKLSKRVSVFHKGVLFPFEYSFSNKKNKIVVFLPGAFNRKNTMPKFQRSGYFSLLDCNCISFFDPSLFLVDDEDFTRAWFIGEKEHSYVETLSEILGKIFNFYGVQSTDVIFFGTSAGGIPAIKLGSKFSGSHVYCGNIQTNLIRHYPAYIRKLSSICFEEEFNEARIKFEDRMSVLKDSGAFNLHLSQNISDTFHLKNHFNPYLDYLKSQSNIKFEVITYEDEKSGHNPIGKDVELKIINSIFESGSFKDCFLDYNSEYFINY